MIADYLAAHYERYNNMPMEPLQITCDLLTPLQGYSNLHLDAMLAWLVVMEATAGQQSAPPGEPDIIPLPLKPLWHDESGFPLWAITDLLPISEAVQITSYIHKRAPHARLVRTKDNSPWNISTSSGTYRDLRIPVPGVLAYRWQALAYSNRQEIERLLRMLPAIGKKRQTIVKAWRVEEADSFNLIDESGRLLRPVPCAALDDYDEKSIVFEGWTPPYWLLHRDCVPVGARADVWGLL